MAKDVITVGNKVSIKLIRSGSIVSRADQETFISQFLQWIDNSVIQIAIPISKGHLVPIEMGNEYLLSFFTPKGLFQCRAIVLERRKQGNIAVADMRMVSDLEKYQRRQFYRMECILPLTYAVITEQQKKMYLDLKTCIGVERKKLIEEQITLEEIDFFTGTILDISGGGMRFNSGHRHGTNDIIVLKPKLNEEFGKKIPYLLARVISSNPIRNREDLFDSRIEYTNILNTEREQIICYIFKTEREKRKRETEM